MIRAARMDELTEGMIVNCHGMRCLIDRPIKVRENSSAIGGKVYSTNTLVLNRDEVPNSRVPFSFTETTSYPSRGMAPEPEGTHRWGIQGIGSVQVAIES